MNHEELLVWQDAVMEHSQDVRKVREDRQLLKEKLQEHLSKFFEFSEIEWDAFFDKIILRFAPDVEPVIRKETIQELGMDWIISTSYDGSANRITVIEVYPFGIEDGE